MAKKEKTESRFILISSERIKGMSYFQGCVLKDKVTGVLYFYWTNSFGGGFTPLIDKDGKPVVDSQE